MNILDRDDFLRRLDAAIGLAGRYLGDAKNGVIPEYGLSVEQLEHLIGHLQTVGTLVRRGPLPSQRDRMAKSISWMISDSWDVEDPLAKEVWLLDNYYVHDLD
jgi:hypothetical protein